MNSYRIIQTMKGFTFLLLALPNLHAADQILVPHLSQSPAFISTIIIENTLDQTRHLILDTYDAQGRDLRSFTLDAPPMTKQIHSPGELFDNLPVAFFKARAGLSLEPGELSTGNLTGLMIGVSFRYQNTNGELAYLAGIDQPAKHWRLYTGSWPEEFDGLAVVPFDTCFRAEISLKQFSAAGELIESTTWTGPEFGYGKWLINLASFFRPVQGSYVDISSNAFLAVSALRGALATDTKAGYLVGNKTEPLPAMAKERIAFLENRKKWDESGIDAYTSTYQNLCFCTEEITRAADLRVNAGWIVDFVYNDDATPVPQTLYRNFKTVPQLFEFIDSAFAANVYELRVNYDPALGYPTEIFIDWDVCTVDEESFIRVENLQTLRN